MTKASWYAILIGTLLAAGCGKGMTFDDDEGNSTADSNGDILSQPYALGTKVRIRIAGTQDVLNGWKLISSAPSVLSIDTIGMSNGQLYGDCTAGMEGSAHITLVDDGNAERHAADVTVKAADDARLYASGLLRLIDPQAIVPDNAEVQETRIVTGGKGVFGVAYFRGADRLYGHGLLDVVAPASVAVTKQTAPDGRITEFMIVTPSTDGAFTLQIRGGTTQLRSMPGVAVPEAQLSSLSLDSQKLATIANGDKEWVYLHTRDGSGHDVHGVYGSFTLDGQAQTGTASNLGDLYRFDYLGGSSKSLVATHGTLHAMTSIEASGGTLFDTTYLGCSAAPTSGRPAAASGFLLGGGLLMLTIFARRRRRRS